MKIHFNYSLSIEKYIGQLLEVKFFADKNFHKNIYFRN